MNLHRLKQLSGLPLTEGITHIDQHNDDGSLDGYVVDTDQEQVGNYLLSQGVSQSRIDDLRASYNRLGIIKNMWVDEESRGQGIGNDLMSGAIDDAYDSGAQAIILIADMGEQNEFNLVKWYENFGFELLDKANTDYLMIMS